MLCRGRDLEHEMLLRIRLDVKILIALTGQLFHSSGDVVELERESRSVSFREGGTRLRFVVNHRVRGHSYRRCDPSNQVSLNLVFEVEEQ